MVAHHKGQNVKVTVRDCASSGGYCSLNLVGLNAWLADHKFFDVTVSLFFLPNHGKMLPDKDFGHCDLCWRDEDVFNADTMMLPLAKLKSSSDRGASNLMDATIHNPAAMDDWYNMMSEQFEIHFAAEVGLTEMKPLIFVYWGAHIKSKEEARGKLPAGWLGDFLTSFYPVDKPAGGGWLGMRRFETDEVKFEYIYRTAPAFVEPLPRVHLLSEVGGLLSSKKLLDEVVTRHLTSADLDTSGNMSSRVERLAKLGPAAVQAAVEESARVREGKKAARDEAVAAAAVVVATGGGAAAVVAKQKKVAPAAKAGKRPVKATKVAAEEKEDSDDDDDDDDEVEAVKQTVKVTKHVLQLTRAEPAEKLGFVYSDAGGEVTEVRTRAGWQRLLVCSLATRSVKSTARSRPPRTCAGSFPRTHVRASRSWCVGGAVLAR